MKNLVKILAYANNFTKIQEGGNAVSNVTRIKLEEINPTLQEVEQQLLSKFNLTLSDVGILGSTGKKASSGDIDLAININMDINTFYTKVTEYIKYEAVLLKGLNIVSIAFPIYDINGNKTNKFVQIDLMKVDDINYAKFSYYSPYSVDYKGDIGVNDTKSKFKGLFRNEVLIAISSVIKEQNLKVDPNGKVLVFKKYQYTTDRGLIELTRSREGKRGILKHFKTINSRFITKDINKITNILVGKSFSSADINSWENCIQTLESDKFVNKDKVVLIIQKLAHNVKLKVKKIFKEFTDKQIIEYLRTLGDSFTKYKAIWDKEIIK